MLKKLGAAIALCVAIMGVTALPAFAHHPTVSGDIVCNEQTGRYDVTWTVANGNWENRTMTLDQSDRSVVPLSSYAPSESKSYDESLPGTTSGETTLTVRGDWDNGGPQNVAGSASVRSSGTCQTPEPEPERKHTICHATSSTTNPYSGQDETITPSKDGVLNGHLDHTGPVPTSQAHLEQLKDDHIKWGDIIPPFEHDGQTYSLNWTAAGQALFNAGCALPEPDPDPDPDPEPKHTICHATNSTTNPYSGQDETITPSQDGVLNGHLDHTGPVPTSQSHLEQLKDDHIKWGDIIPPFEHDGQTYSLNWSDAGQAIFRNGCALPEPEPEPEPELDIVKQADDASVDAGDEIGYTVTVSNDGDGTAEDVELTDELPDDEGLDWEIAGTSGGWDCEIDAGTLTCGGEGFDLDPGDDASVHIVSPTTPDTCGNVRNQAEAEWDATEGQQPQVSTLPDSGNRDDVESEVVKIEVECNPELDIVKQADDASVDAGDEIGYTVTVSNDGDGTAEDVELTDELPDDEGLDWEIAGTSGGWDCEIDAGTLTCGGEGFDLDPGDDASVHIVSPTTPDTCGNVRNQAEADASNAEDDEEGDEGQQGDQEADAGDDDEGDNEDDVESKVVKIEVECTPAIQVVKDGPDVVHRGDTITYLFEVTNVGQLDLFDVELSDPICDEGTIDLVDDGDGDQVLAIDEVWRYTCTRLVTDDDADPLPNTATVRGDAEEGEGEDEVTDTDDHSVDIIHPAIDIVKTASEEIVEIGDTVTYTYVVWNTGDTTLYDISVDDDILGHVGDIQVLEPGTSATLTKDFVMGNAPVTNVAIAAGEDVLGHSVSADDAVTVTPIAGATAPPPTTPFTGSDAARLGLITMVLLGIGVTVVASTRRRRPEREAA